MNALFTAIYTRWTAQMAGRTLYNTEAPGEVAFPYNVVSIINATPDFGFDGETDEEFLIQFNLFSDTTTCEQVGLTLLAVIAAFDKHDLVITGATTISLIRGPANLIYIDKIWQYNVLYKLTIEKN